VISSKGVQQAIVLRPGTYGDTQAPPNPGKPHAHPWINRRARGKQRREREVRRKFRQPGSGWPPARPDAGDIRTRRQAAASAAGSETNRIQACFRNGNLRRLSAFNTASSAKLGDGVGRITLRSKADDLGIGYQVPHSCTASA